MTRKRNSLCTGLCMTALLLAGMAGAMAQTKAETKAQDPLTGGQLNQCWGQTASQVAKLDTSGVDANGGGMGIHSRAAAGQGETFGDAFGFNTDGGRIGVGNVSGGAPHNTAPGDGGNGQHAINNGTDTANGLGFSNIIDPLTGQRGGITGGQTLTCDLVAP